MYLVPFAVLAVRVRALMVVPFYKIVFINKFAYLRKRNIFVVNVFIRSIFADREEPAAYGLDVDVII